MLFLKGSTIKKILLKSRETTEFLEHHIYSIEICSDVEEGIDISKLGARHCNIEKHFSTVLGSKVDGVDAGEIRMSDEAEGYVILSRKAIISSGSRRTV